LIIKVSECIVCRMGWSTHIAIVGISLVACYAPPAPDERFEDSIVVTSHDDATDFGTFQTFFVRPDVRVLDEANLVVDPGVLPETLAPDTAATLVDQTTRNLIARGYQPAATAAEADLAVELVYARTIYTDYYCYYWSDWAYWGYPGYYYYYPYSCDTASWRSGMLVTNAIDLRDAGPAPEVTPTTSSFLRGVWFSGIYGAEVDTNAFLVQRAQEGIDQAFVQSPYFSTTP
jgi:hypothetical protein